MVAPSVALLAVGAVALRWGIAADQDAVRITNTRPHTIPWAQLEDIVLVKVESDIDLGFPYMLLAHVPPLWVRWLCRRRPRSRS